MVQRQSTPEAALWMAGWLLTTLSMTVAGRELVHDIPIFVLLMLRSVVATAILLPIVLWRGNVADRFTKWPIHVGRNALHYSAQYAWFYALSLIPLAQVISIEFTLPIWAAILAALFLGERLTQAKLAAIALGLAGVLLIVKPGATIIGGGHLAALCAALGFAASITLTKYLTRTDSALTVIFMMFAIQTVIGAVPAWLVWQWPEPGNWIWVAVVALAGTFSHFCLAKAMSLADATLVLPLDFLRVPLTALAGFWLYAEGFDLLAILGAGLILAANTLNLLKARTP